ncbi:hypothetical protein Ocin01_13940 [Orchesella cincta]|uniref:Uncharacterized protein n=1 Tax=Orchesella cincta TaxID=48709 RepID=A0A1D2MIA1_ORCCI|nr:hypothetical protein Ocin01_13940 [Orchesella cincta]
MAKYTVIMFSLAACFLAYTSAIPRLYNNRYSYYPPAPGRFSGWTVTSQELLALPSTNDHKNIVQVAPPAGFIRPHHISRSRRDIEMTPDFVYMIPDADDMLNFS